MYRTNSGRKVKIMAQPGRRQKIPQKISYDRWNPSVREVLLSLLEAASLIAAADYLFYESAWALIPMLPAAALVLKMNREKALKERKALLAGQFRHALRDMGTSLKAGYSIENAITLCRRDMEKLYGREALMAKELTLMESQIRLSVPAWQLFMDLAGRSGDEDIGIFASAYAAARQSGGDVGNVMQKVSRMLGDKMDVRSEIDTALSSRKLEQGIMSLMPALIMAYLKLSSPGFMAPLYGNSFGIVFMSVCLAFYIGAWEMGRRIVDIRV